MLGSPHGPRTSSLRVAVLLALVAAAGAQDKAAAPAPAADPVA